MTTPPVHPESQPCQQARTTLTWILGNPDATTEDRLAAGDALTALHDAVPTGTVLAPAPQTPGTIDDARHLLEAAAPLETTVRGTLAVAEAPRHLRRRTPTTP
jgi:hypothetical protein